MHTLDIDTPRREACVDITSQVRELVRRNGWRHGALALFCPHTTCGLTVNEGADPDVARDMTEFLNALIPRQHGFRHAEGNSDAHVKASLMGPSLHLIVEDGQVLLGTWQAVYLVEGDGPRTRHVWAQWLQAS